MLLILFMLKIYYTAPTTALGFTWPNDKNLTFPLCNGYTVDGRSGTFLTPIDGSSGVTIYGKLLIVN